MVEKIRIFKNEWSEKVVAAKKGAEIVKGAPNNPILLSPSPKVLIC